MGIIGTIFGTIAIWIIIVIATIRIICNFLAKRVAEEIKYDYLAQRIAEEICKRMMIIERQKGTAYKAATPTAETQDTDTQ